MIITPFNYPFQLIFKPLINTITTNNTTIIKPSKLTPNITQIIKQLINKTFNTNYIKIIKKKIKKTQTLIHLPFNYIFFTKNKNINKIIYQTTNKNLIPITLKINNKSPIIINKTTNIKITNKHIYFKKFTNTNQTYITPNYILIHKSIKNNLITTLSKTLHKFYNQNIQQNPNYNHIINLKHYHHLTSLLNNTQINIIFNNHNNKNKHYIKPTLLDHITNNSTIIQKKIFNPILPILTYQSLNKTITFIHQKPKPLNLYLFNKNKNTTQHIINKLSFNNNTINNTLIHLTNPKLPFNNINTSNIKHYHNKYSFNTFTHKKNYIFKSTQLKSNIHLPPYKNKFKYIKTFFKN